MLDITEWLLNKGWIIILALMVALCIAVYFGINHIAEIGLKTIVMNIWNGTGS